MKQYIFQIRRIVGNDNKKMIMMLGLFILSSIMDLIGVGLIIPYIVMLSPKGEIDNQIVVDAMSAIGLNSVHDMFFYLNIVIVVVFLVKSVISVYVNYAIVKFSNQQQARIQLRLMRVYQNLSYVDYLTRNSSEYIHAIQNHTSSLRSSVIIILKTISDIIVVTFFVTMLAYINLFALLLLLVILGVSSVMYDYFCKENIYNFGKSMNISSTIVIKKINEYIHGFKEIRIIGVGEYFYNIISNNVYKIALNNTRIITISSIPRHMLEFLLVVFIVLLVMFESAEGVTNIVITVGVFAMSSIRILPAVNSILSGMVQIRSNKYSVSKIYNDLFLLDNRKYIASTNNKHKEDDFSSLSLLDVSYKYPTARKNTINNVSLNINKGDSIGIIGESGGGKTTLIDLFLGLIEPQKGSIKYNQKPLSESLDEWNSKIAYLPQDTFLIDDTLRNNIAIGITENDIDDELIHQALTKSQLISFVESLPNGLNTIVGERGVNLSGGQKQRISLARAFYRRKDILILDESTSALDEKTERKITREVNQLKGEATIIIITHNLSILKGCDQVYKIVSGEITKIKV
jgi:ATP-binding cassette, subfamily B, bacterial PglK